jgi:D-arabinose 1-dehydrogenase-like Zn-dependent alcohol dehydrogenase
MGVAPSRRCSTRPAVIAKPFGVSRYAHIAAANGPFVLGTRAVPTPGPGQVLVRIRACGVCHSDDFVKTGAFPGLQLPRVPGHEVAGVVAGLGSGVRGWKEGDRVGVGWHGGHCFVCDSCRRGDFITCREGKVCGISYDGGYADHLIAPAEALARIPNALSDTDAGPLMCAGITTFNALRNSPARSGDLVAVQGIGGLGHLAVQFASRMGFRTVAIARGADKRALALDLGAHDYIDTTSEKPADALMARGGAKVVLATAPNADAVTAVLDGIGPGGQLLLVAAVLEPLPVSALALIGPRRSIQGWPSGTAKDSEDTLAFAAATGVRPRIETFPLERVEEAFQRMHSGKARFRAVLTMDGAAS